MLLLLLSHNLKAESCFDWWKCLELRARKTASQWLWENPKKGGGEISLYTSLQQRKQAIWTSEIRYQVKEFSTPCMGRYKPLGSLNLFLSYAENSTDWEAPQSLVGYSPWGPKESDTTEWLHFHFQLRKQETNSVSLSTLRSGRCLLLVSSQLLSSHRWVGGSICWISVFGALGCPGGLDGKEFACNVGDLGSILGLGRSPREENGYPLQYSGLENSMDRGAWESTTHGVAESWTQTQLSDFQFYSCLEAGNW